MLKKPAFNKFTKRDGKRRGTSQFLVIILVLFSFTQNTAYADGNINKKVDVNKKEQEVKISGVNKKESKDNFDKEDNDNPEIEDDKTTDFLKEEPDSSVEPGLEVEQEKDQDDQPDKIDSDNSSSDVNHKFNDDESKQKNIKKQESKNVDEEKNIQANSKQTSSSNEFQEGDRDPFIIKLKEGLTTLGFGGMNINDHYGSFTVTRVEQFQDYYGLTVNGIADSRTQKKIDEILSSHFQKGKSHKDVIQLKRNLISLGYGGMNVNESYGSFTATRVKQFQRDHGLKDHGIADERTLSKISELLSNVFQEGNRHQAIIKLKENLKTLGFGGMNINEIYGSYTTKRVKDFQKYYGLSVTGKGDKATLQKIDELLTSPFRVGGKHKDVIQLKRNLISLGYGGMNVNETYGSFTAKRVKQFQKDNGLINHGIADEITFKKINDLLSNVLQEGSRHKDVIKFKRDLTTLGFGGMNINEHYGSFTTKRVKEFQTYYELSVTGKGDKATLQKIKDLLSSSFREGGKHKDVILLKQNLISLGYGGMNVNETYGSFTATRVKQFQRDHGLKAHGIADEKTFNKINDLLINALQEGSRHPAVIKFKKDLTTLGFGGMNINENYGSYTTKRVKDFQSYYGLSKTGTGDKATLKKVNDLLSGPFREGESHKDVIQLKKDLITLGFGGMNVNNSYGSFTAKRVRDLQSYYGLTVNGIADDRTLEKINGILSSPFHEGGSHKDVISLKEKLITLDFGGMNVNQTYGSFTAKRVKQFQEYYGLTINGIADDRTQAKLDAILSSHFREGKSHKDVVQLKENLTSLGYGGMNINETYGSFTAKRVKEFQQDHGLKAHGIADEVTLSKITQILNTKVITFYTDYKLTINQALDIQIDRPIVITDKYRNDPAYVSAKYLKLTSNNQGITTVNVNVRSGPGASNHKFGVIPKNSTVQIVNEGKEWHQIKYDPWRTPTREDIKEYLDPSKNDKFQHLRLDSSVGVSASELNKVLSGKGILAGQGQAFINGAKKHGINEAYLIAHAFLETGHGTSTLATGVEVGKDKKGKPVRVTTSNRKDLTDIKTTYNMFGIGAVDSNALNGGAITAYENGWFTPAAAIEGGAKWIGEGYIYNDHKQNTLYKMKWNPRMSEGYAWKQYATDIGWAVKQVSGIKNIYDQLNNPSYHYDIAKYK